MLVTCAGILVADIIASGLPKVSGPGEVVFTDRPIELHIGGHAANVSVDLLKLGLEKGTVSAIGAIGNDIFGTYIKEILERYGVVCHLQNIGSSGTSKDMILVVKGEDRRYHVDIGANWYLDQNHVQKFLLKEKPKIFYLGGAGLLGSLDENLSEILKFAKDIECLTFLDPVAPYRHDWRIFVPALEWTDIFHCNNIEAEKITGKINPVEAAQRLLKWGTKLVLISLGAKGLIASLKRRTIKMPAFKVPVVDPTGAGDALCSGFIYGLAKKVMVRRELISLEDIDDESLLDIMLEGEAAGAACVTMVGTTTGVSREKVDKILKEQRIDIINQTQFEICTS
ncbi:TPA: carbohydrate kinase family protein [Candidatus Bathyarchaeota archaeon]|nr:carbohydrate kinase family protein [Candidatus Bathyarchaeota archaeon]